MMRVSVNTELRISVLKYYHTRINSFSKEKIFTPFSSLECGRTGLQLTH